MALSKAASDDILQFPIEVWRQFHTVIRSYERWILGNAESLGYLESTLRGLLFLMPGGYQDSPLRTEAGYAAVSLLSLYHDLVFIRFFQKQPQQARLILRKIPQGPLFPISTALTVCSNVELLLEIIAWKYWRKSGKWTVVILIECFKSLLRANALAISGGRMLVQQILPNREIMMSENRPPLVTSTPTFRRFVGELLYVIRPLVYVILLLWKGRKSWLPWILSLGVDGASRLCIGSSTHLSDIEKDEVARRTVQMLYYILRSPFFELYINRLDFLKSIQSIPLLGVLFKSMLEYVTVYRRYYFYTAGSS